ncbi:hypothetical protein AIF0345_1423 [Actinomyces israelii]|nr:hypothetical protein AIF0345_1423 [Actinomyces israelii]
MSGRRAAQRDGRSLDGLVRLACSTDPDEPVRRPRRIAVAPRAAMVLGAALIALALLLALRTVMNAPGSRPQAGPAATATAGAGETPAGGEPATGPATGPATMPDGGPGHSGAEPGGTGEVLVHVVGAVRSPGVVRLPAGARVVDAIEAAGGVREDAQTDQLNLARIVADGEQVRVPVVGEAVEAAPASETGTTPSAGAGAGGSGLINVNTASADELEKLPGIGPALAERIVSHRQAHGPFASLDDLTDVPGIGRAKLEALRSEATV